MIFVTRLGFVFLFFHSGCVFGKSTDAKKSPVHLPVRILQFNNGSQIEAEMAITLKDKAKGLMFRDTLGPSQGMLFVYPNPHRLSFWMKNTFIPLDIGFFDEANQLVNIVSMTPQIRGPIAKQDLRSYQCATSCKSALEVNPGWFGRHNIFPGATYKILPKSN